MRMELVKKIDEMDDPTFFRYALSILQKELGVYGFARFLRVYRAGRVITPATVINGSTI